MSIRCSEISSDAWSRYVNSKQIIYASKLAPPEFPSGVFVLDMFEVAQELCTQRSGLNTPACMQKSYIDKATSNIAAKQKSYSDELSALRVAKLRQSSKRIASLDASSTRCVVSDRMS